MGKLLLIHERGSHGGQSIFFSYFGIALSNVGYNIITPVLKKKRRTAYKGLTFNLKSAKTCKGTIDAETVIEWMTKSYCEGEEDDIITKEEIWSKFQEELQMDEEKRPTFFSLLGNSVFSQPPFLNVRPCRKQGKVSYYQHLRNRPVESNDQSGGAEPKSTTVASDVKIVAGDVFKSCHEKSTEQRAEAEVEPMNISVVDNDETLDVTDEHLQSATCTTFDATKKAKDERKINSDEESVKVMPRDQDDCALAGDVSESCHEESSTHNSNEMDEWNMSVEDSNDTYHFEDKPQQSDSSNKSDETDYSIKLPTKKIPKLDYDEESGNVPTLDENVNAGLDAYYSDTDSSASEDAVDNNDDESMEEKVLASGSCSVSSPIELSAEDIFQRYHKHLDRLMPSRLPGKPLSFQAFLKNRFIDPSNFVVERTSIHLSSAVASTYKDTRMRAFLAATFPPIRVGSLAGEGVDISFQDDTFPQFIHVAKGNFKCTICIPYLRWAILNNQTHSAARSKKATTDAILAGTADLEFSGLVQVQEHSVSV